MAFFFCGGPFLDKIADNRADAYGPFWIATTLIFLVSVTSHLQALMEFSGDVFEYDFKAVTFSAMVIYSYLGCAAFAVWLGLTYFLKVPIRLLDCVCIVGYSLCGYLPAAVLCVVPYMRWPACLAACVASSGFAFKALLPAVVNHAQPQKAAFFGGYAVSNVLFMLCIAFVYK